MNYDILLWKLHYYGVRGTPLNWFKNYLHDRTQFVTINNTKSNYETLGPFLFLLNINFFPKWSKKLSFRIFADTNMFDTSDKLQHLETVMSEELKLVFK